MLTRLAVLGEGAGFRLGVKRQKDREVSERHKQNAVGDSDTLNMLYDQK